MRRDTLTGYLIVLVGDDNDLFRDEISNLGIANLIFDTTAIPTQQLVDEKKYRFVTPELFKEKYFTEDYLFKWDTVQGSFGIFKNTVYNALRKGQHLVCSLSFDNVIGFINNRKVPKKNYILINCTNSGEIPKGFDEYSFDFTTSNIDEICKIVKRHI
ncbi:MAG: hypothetical protein HRU03_00575 [Nanoarchaeales archaeon]|nr:hypothetical protein [Nanoarchaeales archaeon]